MGPPEPLTAIEEDLLVFDEEIKQQAEWLDWSSRNDLHWAFKHGWKSRQVREDSASFWAGTLFGMLVGALCFLGGSILVYITR